MSATYVCPFCGAVIDDSNAALIEHRKEGGECDRRMEAAT